MKESKTKTLKKHLDKRSLERLGFILSPEQKKRLVADIQANRLRFLWRTSHNRTAWEATINDQVMAIIYDKKRQLIVTVLYIQEEDPCLETPSTYSSM
jgi:hypothetical protein